MNKTITLSPTEVRIVKFIGAERFKYCRSVGAQATIYNEANAIQADHDAYGGEFAFCKLFGIMPDMDTTRFPSFDARLPNGDTVDVKTTHKQSHRLIVKPLDHAVDLYALMIGSLPTYTFVGMARAVDVRKPQHLDERLPFPAYAVAQSELYMPIFISQLEGIA